MVSGTSGLPEATFFKAKDGIRDLTVTGVQTCALPISFVQEQRDVFERWQRLAHQVVAAPDMVLVPAPRVSSTEGPIARYLALRERAKPLFSRERGNLARLLGDPQILKQSSHKVEKVPEWLEEVAA